MIRENCELVFLCAIVFIVFLKNDAKVLINWHITKDFDKII